MGVSSNLVYQHEDFRLAGCDLGDDGPLHGDVTGSGAESNSNMKSISGSVRSTPVTLHRNHSSSDLTQRCTTMYYTDRLRSRQTSAKESIGSRVFMQSQK